MLKNYLLQSQSKQPSSREIIDGQLRATVEQHKRVEEQKVVFAKRSDFSGSCNWIYDSANMLLSMHMSVHAWRLGERERIGEVKREREIKR